MQTILNAYNLSPSDYLGSGMEAQVYQYGLTEVLKIYPNLTHHANISALQRFYMQLNRTAVPFAIPEIVQIDTLASHIVVCERRLSGTPLQTMLPSLSIQQLGAVMEHYLDTVMHVPMLAGTLDDTRVLQIENPPWQSGITDWHAFWLRRLQRTLDSDAYTFLRRDVPQFAQIIAYLQDYLHQPYTGQYGLVHGDFYPGNVLVDDQLHISAVFDFSNQTMWGDPVYDIATSWVWFDMYDELECDVRSRYKEMLIRRFGKKFLTRCELYVLLYSIIFANYFDNACQDGHYQWSVANLRAFDVND